MTRIAWMLALLATITVGGCETASVPLANTSADAEGRAFPAPPPGMASLYAFRLGDVGTLVGVTIGPRNLGPLGNYTWFQTSLQPGTYDVRCVGGEDSKQVSVTLAPGETRFVQVDAVTGWWAARCTIAEVPADRGRSGVLAGKRAAELR